ncbi:MAG: phosphohydrolase [Bacilli bacterium]|nr:phosphohydrolase [Bacilli bacterium]
MEQEFLEIIEPVLENSEFQRLKGIAHHGLTRYDHCIRVAYGSYVISKALHLNYMQVTEAALLHDFFIDEVKDMGPIKRLQEHPKYALENAKKYYSLTPMQEDIILTHMFPVTFLPPKYFESWIVDIVDDVVAIYEKALSTKRDLKPVQAMHFIFVMNFIKMF